MARRKLIYEGKAKILYEGPEPGTIVQYFKDDATAFNAEKHDVIEGKGVLNNRSVRVLHDRAQQHRRADPFHPPAQHARTAGPRGGDHPAGVVVRNFAAGSMSKRLGIDEGTQLPRPIIEFSFKDDALGDPLVTEEHIMAFNWASQQDLDDIVALALRVNDFLSGVMLRRRHPARRFQDRGRPGLGRRLSAADRRRRDQPRQLPAVGHRDRPEARQGRVPPRSGAR
jgi:phosphoribosylaminoimidazole-succinocarboxamide synthase